MAHHASLPSCHPPGRSHFTAHRVDISHISGLKIGAHLPRIGPIIIISDSKIRNATEISQAGSRFVLLN